MITIVEGLFCSRFFKQVDVSRRFSPSPKPHSAPPTNVFQSPCNPKGRSLSSPTKDLPLTKTKCLSLRCQSGTNVFELPLIIGQAAASVFWKPAAYISGYPSGQRLALSLVNTSSPFFYCKSFQLKAICKDLYCFELSHSAFRFYWINIL